jgi:hypothetical protein
MAVNLSALIPVKAGIQQLRAKSSILACAGTIGIGIDHSNSVSADAACCRLVAPRWPAS